MSGKDLLEAMSHVEEQYVDEAENARPAKANRSWMRWASLAACLCAVVFGALSFGHSWNPAQPESGTNNSHMEMEPDVGQPELGAPDGVTDMEMQPESNSITEECPSVIVRVDAWQEDGFLGTVAEIVDTDIFEIGTELTVLFDEEVSIAYPAGDQTAYDGRTPTEADFPARSLVQVQFVSYEEETGTILVSMISTP